ncbi:MAG: hypothetical protein LBO69_08310, partial [Ignavibacteria bacterium]|nr:hypothetical protein [Ignavibacteria bacterium]
MRNVILKIGFLFVLSFVIYGCGSVDPSETLNPSSVFRQEICDSCENIMPPWWCCAFYPEYAERLGIICDDCYDHYGRDTCDCLAAPDLCCDTNRQLAKSLGINCIVDPCSLYPPIICDSCERNHAWCCENYPELARAKGYGCSGSICDRYPDLCRPPLCDSIWWLADTLVDSIYYAAGKISNEGDAIGAVSFAFGVNFCGEPYFDAMSGINYLAHYTATSNPRNTEYARYIGGNVYMSITNEDIVSHIADLRIYVENAVDHQNGIYRNVYIRVSGKINMNNADANYLDIYDMIYERAVADIDNPDQIKPIPEADLK